MLEIAIVAHAVGVIPDRERGIGLEAIELVGLRFDDIACAKDVSSIRCHSMISVSFTVMLYWSPQHIGICESKLRRREKSSVLQSRIYGRGLNP